MTDKAGIPRKLWAFLAMGIFVAAIALTFFSGRDGKQAVDAQERITSNSFSSVMVRPIGPDGTLAAKPFAMPRIELSKEERTVVHVHGHLSESSIDELLKACGSAPGAVILDLAHLSSACTLAVATLRKLRNQWGAPSRNAPLH